MTVNWRRLMPGEGRIADRAALAAMKPFRRRGSNLWAIYGATADLGYLWWDPSLAGYQSSYVTMRNRGCIAYTVMSYRTPIAWVKVQDGYAERVYVPRNPRWSRTTNNHRATTAATLGIDRNLISAQHHHRYVFEDHVYRLRELVAEAQRAARREAVAAQRAEEDARLAAQRVEYQQWLRARFDSPDATRTQQEALRRAERQAEEARQRFHAPAPFDAVRARLTRIETDIDDARQQMSPGYHVTAASFDATMRYTSADGHLVITPAVPLSYDFYQREDEDMI